MTGVNKTLYIPLYGKAYVSNREIILRDKKAEEIWAKEGFALKGKSRSKWLAFYMGMRSAVFDNWLRQQMADAEDTVVIHIGCGMDSRVLRIGTAGHKWYDVDFPEVIRERKRYYDESIDYQMIEGDIRNCAWLESIAEAKRAVVVMEGVSMYLSAEELNVFTAALSARFEQVTMLMDCYTVLAARLSKYQNPVNDVGVTEVYGIDHPELLERSGLSFVQEHDMTPQHLINELSGVEKHIFRKLYAGKMSRKLYRMFEYKAG